MFEKVEYVSFKNKMEYIIIFCKNKKVDFFNAETYRDLGISRF